MYASLNKAIIVSDNSLSSVRRQAIIWTNGGSLPIGPLRTNSSEILMKIQNSIHENASENIVCEMEAILSRGDQLKLQWRNFWNWWSASDNAVICHGVMLLIHSEISTKFVNNSSRLSWLPYLSMGNCELIEYSILSHVGPLRGKTNGYHEENCCILQFTQLVAAHEWSHNGNHTWAQHGQYRWQTRVGFM